MATIATTTNKGGMVHHLNIKTTFLNRDLKEEVCVTQPFGCVIKTVETKVCRILKALYGLKQTP